MSRAVLALGSNVGDRFGYLSAAISGLGPRLVAVSSVYENPPWGPVPQQDYFNAVVIVSDDDCSALDWLDVAARFEQAAGRTRDLRFGPRSLDVDVITVTEYGHTVLSADPWLTLPHPRAGERPFVLVPWAEIAPDDVLPGHGRVSDLVAALSAEQRAQLTPRTDLRWAL